MSSASPTPTARTFRLPRSAYLIVLFLVFCTVPLALGDNSVHSAADAADKGGTGVSGIELGPRALLLLLPIVVACFIARTATTVSPSGIRVRALLGSRTLAWSDLRGLSVEQRSVYAVCHDGSVRLPCVRVNDLAAVSAASDGRLPEVSAPKLRFAPSRRRPRGIRRR
ncbi:MAG: PH domain-containing protein [Jatrophihabitantaceae bacterium]